MTSRSLQTMIIPNLESSVGRSWTGRKRSSGGSLESSCGQDMSRLQS